MKLFNLLFRCLCLVLLCATSAQALNLVTAQAYWEDTSGQVSFDQAQNQTYTPYQGVLNQGYTNSVTWLRIRLSHQTSNAQDRHIVLRVLPNYLDEVELFDPLDPRAQPRRVGDATAYADQEYKSLAYGFILPIAQEDRDVWLSVKSTNLHLIRVDAHGEVAMQSEEKSHLLTVSVCIGLMLFILGFNLFNWVWNREWLYTVFVVRTLFFLLTLCIYFGIARVFLDEWLSPPFLDWAFSLGVIGVSFLGCYFEFALLREFSLKAWTRWLQSCLYSLIGMALWLFVMGWRMEALAVNAVLVLAMLLSLLITAIWGTEHRYTDKQVGISGLDKRYLMAYYGVVFFSHPAVNQRLQSWFDASYEVTNLFTYYALLSTVATAMIVQFRANRMLKSHNKLMMDVALMDERMASERQRREEQSNLLSMLMHEVRNPLAVIEVAQNQENAGNEHLVRKNVGIIRNVLDRTLKLEKVSHGQLHMDKTRFLFSDCLSQALEELGADESRVSLLNVTDEYVYTDYESLLTIMGNLLGNALKYSPPGDKVQLEVKPYNLPERLEFVVSNRIGDCGQPDASRVFEKYYRGEGAKKLSGTGVGLYLVQQLVQKLGGTCVFAADTHTICFEVSLPVSDA